MFVTGAFPSNAAERSEAKAKRDHYSESILGQTLCPAETLHIFSREKLITNFFKHELYNNRVIIYLYALSEWLQCYLFEIYVTR